MLDKNNQNAIFRKICILIFISLSTLFFNCKGNAQSLGDPIVDITFGSGTSKYAGPLPADSGSTTYIYSGGTPNDNYYTIVNNSSNTNSGWWITTDHTGNPGGYFMIVNGSYTPGIFYSRTVTGLCGNTKYQFAAWIKNLLNYNGILPNVTFSIETALGAVLATGNTGNIPTGNIWIQYPFTFTVPVNTSTIVLKMINNAPGGIGNDIAIDDITFRPYGDPVAVVFHNTATMQKLCSGISQMINIDATSKLDFGYQQKLQLFVNGIWTDQSTPGTTSSFVFLSPTTAGTYKYRIVTGLPDNIGTPSCVVSSNQLILTVSPKPTAAFRVADTTCLGGITSFSDRTVLNGDTVKSWQWDFGDGQSSTLQNPAYLYTSPGNYTVKLTLVNNNGCTSAPATKIIHISPTPTAVFNFSTPDCDNMAVTLIDQSTSAEGKINSWQWDYGDGSKEIKTDNKPFQHIYATTGTYTIKLSVAANSGCSSSVTKTIVIHPVPLVNFGTPAVCLADSYALFTDSTTIADNSSAGFTYLWNFGDTNATAANPNSSTLKSPSHKYTRADTFQVTLKVTSISGCQFTKTKTFTVNGSVPKAVFDVTNPALLFSNKEVFFTNQSTVDFGSITKIKWYFDLTDTTQQLTDINPYPGKLYRHTYAKLYSPPATRNFQVRMLAYSGGSCVSQVDKTITLLAIPNINFTPPASICQNSGTIQLNALETTGITGSGIYSGPGVNASGLFDPSVSGVGLFSITYIFTAISGSADTISKLITVNAAPTVSAGGDITILEGGTGKLNAIATGDSLSYAWQPAAGLSSSQIANPVVTVTQDVTYTISVTNNKGCSASGRVKVSVLKSPLIPNAFTPNGDGINDNWEIKYLNSYSECTVTVFNRNGQKVYDSIGYTVPWDGRLNNVELPAGVYYYVINPKHGRKVFSGSVSIIR